MSVGIIHEPQSIMDSVIDQISRIESLTLILDPTLTPFFISYDHIIPVRIDPSELGFTKMLSWFYVMLKETGKLNVDFWGKRLGLVPQKNMPNFGFYGVINDLRTFMQHYVLQTQTTKLDNCRTWFLNACGKEYPDSAETEWLSCLITLLRQGEAFFQAFRTELESLTAEEEIMRETVLHQWREHRSNNHRPETLDGIIFNVSREMGRPLDIGEFRKTNEKMLLKRIDLKETDPRFDSTARYVIERHLLIESIGNLPITAEDILEELVVPPGGFVGDLMRKALGHFILGTKTKTALLEKLRQEIE